MSKPLRICWTIALLLLFQVNIGIAHGQEVNFCLFSMPQGVLQANASFNMVYDFDLDAKGAPLNIRPVTQKFADPADVSACIGEWRFPDSASKHLTAVFEWHHSVGWERLAITGPGVKLVIRLSGQRCPYCGKREGGEKPSGAASQ